MFKYLKLLNPFIMLGADGGDGGGGGSGAGDKGAVGKTFSQEDVDKIVQERLSRERSKYGDYDELVKFRKEHESEQEKLKQDELIRQKKYDEAEANMKKQIESLSSTVSEKDASINNLKIEHALVNEISKQGGYVEEALALLKSSAIIREGQILVKIKDANGIEKEVTVDHGVKDFLSQKPYLVRAKGNAGGDATGAGAGAGAGAGVGSGNEGDTLKALNADLFDAMNRNDRKRVDELKAKIRPLLKGNRDAA